MPIKFRCSYCRQFLGISRGRAGGIVDCPTCGRSIRVPGLDGVALPVPAPELNRQDSKLMRALDELANWDSPRAAPAMAVETAPEEEVEIPQPIAEPIPIEVPVAPEPISIQPPPAIESARQPGPVGAISDASPAINVAQALEELQRLTEMKPTPLAAVVPPPTYAGPVSRKMRVGWIAAFVAMTGLAFLGGYLAGNRRSHSPEIVEQPQESAPPAEPAPAIAGRISYHTADGSSLPDRGARVLVLPREREGEAILPIVGFRAGDHPADIRLATAALEALGGDFAVADEGGQFQVRLPNPGTYHIVAISRYADRSDSAMDPELTRLLTPYFDQPAQLLGRTKIHFGQVRYKGTGAEIWDHAF
jgi:hypothetical protein